MSISFIAALLIVILAIAAFFLKGNLKFNNKPIDGPIAPFIRLVLVTIILFVIAALGHFLWLGFIYLKSNVF